MRLFLALCLALAGFAHAATVTVNAANCSGFDTAADAGGNVILTCRALTTTPPVVTPPVITPPIVTPPGACPATPANVTMVPTLTSGLAGRIVDRARTDGMQPTIYSVALPKGHPNGGFYTTRDPDTPPSMQVQLSISKCPGDYATAKTDPGEVYYGDWDSSKMFPYYPCTAAGGAESASLFWGPKLQQNYCPLDPSIQWYGNIRVTDEKGVYSCPIASAQGPGCPLRYWWN